MLTQPRHGVRREERRHTARHRHHVGKRIAQPGEELGQEGAGTLLDTPPEGAQAFETMLWRVAGDQRGVDGANRRADDPIRFDAGLVQRLVHANLVSA